MELKIKKDLLHFPELMFENTSEHSIDGDITLPDYCPDIKRILKCIVNPCLLSEQCTGDRATVDANASVQVIYVDDSNNVFCYEKVFPFSKTIEFGKLIDKPVAEIKMKTAYANSRAISQRRIDIHASVAISVSVVTKKDIEVVSEAENCGIQLQKNIDNISNFIGNSIKTFTLNEVMEIGKSKSPIRQIIRNKLTAHLTETKVINNKMLIKGDAKISVLYCADENEIKYETYENTLPINQIIDFEGIDEKSKYQIQIYITSFNLVPKINSSGEKKLIDATINITSVIKAENDVDKTYPCDCYSTKFNTKCEKKVVSFEKIYDTFDDLIMIKKSEDFTNTKISEIINVWCDDVITTYTCNGNDLKIIGNTNISVLGKDDAAEPFYAERVLSFEKNISLPEVARDLICVSNAIVNGIDFVLADSNKLDLRVEFLINGTLIKRNTTEIITDIFCDESMPKDRKYSALTIYFCDDGELIWEIARKYNTTVDAIKIENELDENIIKEKSMLLIPCV